MKSIYHLHPPSNSRVCASCHI